jgi:hypothetical protein
MMKQVTRTISKNDMITSKTFVYIGRTPLFINFTLFSSIQQASRRVQFCFEHNHLPRGNQVLAFAGFYSRFAHAVTIVPYSKACL